MAKGTVKWYNPEKGYGFIAQEDSGNDLFVHRSAVGTETINEGDQVEFDIVESDKGPRAENVQVTQSSGQQRY